VTPLLLVLLVATPPPAATPSDQREFDAAIKRETTGDWTGAAAALERLGHDHPDSNFADDALFEAAVLSEERLSDPASAARLYREVATQYPQSRLARRARTRADFLESSLRTGAQPLAEYQRILAEGSRDPRGAILAMEQLLQAHPEFALTDRALFWLASRLVEAGRERDGVERYLELERRFPSSEWARRSLKARADLLLSHGSTREARGIYLALSRSTDPIARAGGTEGLRAVGTSRLRRALVIASLVYLALFLGFHLFVGRRQLWPLPAELLYYLPVAGLFTAAAATENTLIGWATGGMAAGGALVTWSAAASTGARLVRGRIGGVQRLLGAAALALAVLAVAFVAVQWSGLTDLVLETMRNGPER
jgi:Tetratricopeptide repeat